MHNINHYKKYQVYFFLYLAVICELLIIIVERDESEEALLWQQRQTEILVAKVVSELIQLKPVSFVSGTDQVQVGEEKEFFVTLKGLTNADRVTEPPIIEIERGGVIIHRIGSGDVYPIDSLASGAVLFGFKWTPAVPGEYRFYTVSGTDRISFTPDKGGKRIVKVGGIEVEEAVVQKALDSNPDFDKMTVEGLVGQSSEMTSTMIIKVTAPGDQLALRAENLVTATNFNAINRIYVSGTETSKVTSIIASTGRIERRGDVFVWIGEFNKPGVYNVSLKAYDNRNAGTLSTSIPESFTVEVKNPVLDALPELYVGESRTINLAVAGLEDVSLYTWEIQTPTETLKGTGSKALVTPNAAGKVLVRAFYNGKPYRAVVDGKMMASEFTLVSHEVPYRLQTSIKDNNDYAITQTFEFTSAKCGVCASGNIKPIDRSEIRVDGEIGGRDAIDEIQIVENPNHSVTVTFWLDQKIKVSKDGDDLVLTIKYGPNTKQYTLRIFPN